jgi:PAP2 superfamily
MRYAIALTLVSALSGSPAAGDLVGNEVNTWNEVNKWSKTASKASFASGLSNNPLFESRVYAMTHVAIHDALNGIDRRYLPYAYYGTVAPNASPEAAVATAAHRVLVRQFTLLTPYGFATQRAMLDEALESSLALIPGGSSKDAGIAVGTRAANAILAMRVADGWNWQVVQDFNYPQGNSPGEYRFTPPNNFAFLPGWGNVQPFVLYRAHQYRPDPPYPVNSSQYTADFNEIKRLGGDGVTTPSARTPDQTQIARFWYESSPQGWNRIARRVSAARELGLWENGRLFALLNLTLADGYIANFDTKYHYNYWRPITAIRLADSDGNPNTRGDTGWTPLLETPAVPDYVSGHSTQGGAAAEIMKLFFGTDSIAFSTCSTTMPASRNCDEASQVQRSFSSFSEAAEENALSRILVGIHFRKACTEGVRHGRKIAQHTFLLYLIPLR